MHPTQNQTGVASSIADVPAPALSSPPTVLSAKTTFFFCYNSIFYHNFCIYFEK
jgi:hypothetical protein